MLAARGPARDRGRRPAGRTAALPSPARTPAAPRSRGSRCRPRTWRSDDGGDRRRDRGHRPEPRCGSGTPAIGFSLDETSVSNLWKLTPAEREQAIRLLVDPKTGAGLDRFRLTIGSPDLIEHLPFWSYDELPAGVTEDFGAQALLDQARRRPAHRRHGQADPALQPAGDVLRLRVERAGLDEDQQPVHRRGRAASPAAPRRTTRSASCATTASTSSPGTTSSTCRRTRSTASRSTR